MTEIARDGLTFRPVPLRKEKILDREMLFAEGLDRMEAKLDKLLHHFALDGPARPISPEDEEMMRDCAGDAATDQYLRGK